MIKLQTQHKSLPRIFAVIPTGLDQIELLQKALFSLRLNDLPL